METYIEIYNNVKEWYNGYQNPLNRNKGTIKFRIQGYINGLPSEIKIRIFNEAISNPITSSHFDGDVEYFLMMLKCKMK